MIVRNFVVVPHGLIQSGSVALKIDEVTGLIDASETAVVGLPPFFSKTLSQHDDFKIDPTLLLSENVKPGLKLNFGPVALEVISATQAKVTFSQGDDTASGIAVLDLSGKYLHIVSLNATGTVEGFDLTLELNQVASANA